MKKFKIALVLLLLTTFSYAQTPFNLRGVKSYYTVVEINTDRIDAKYKNILLNKRDLKRALFPVCGRRLHSRGLDQGQYCRRSLA